MRIQAALIFISLILPVDFRRLELNQARFYFMKPKKRGARSGKTRVFVSKLPSQFPLGLGRAWANIRWQKNCDSGVRKGTCDWRDHNRHLCDLQLAGTVPAQPKVQKHSMRRLRYQILLRS